MRKKPTAPNAGYVDGARWPRSPHLSTGLPAARVARLGKSTHRDRIDQERTVTPAWHTTHEYGEFAKARAHAEHEALILRGRAVRTVAYQSVDADDCRRLLSMLGLDDADRSYGG
jgi:hypothetical protein